MTTKKPCSTKKGFLEALAATLPFIKWKKHADGDEIRGKRKRGSGRKATFSSDEPGQQGGLGTVREYCPITAVASVRQVGEFYEGDAAEPECRGPLGITDSFADDIMNAADTKGTHVRRLRDDMLKVLGLPADEREEF